MPSPFVSQLGTNYHPREEEIAEIDAPLVVPTLRLEHLDAEIAVLQKALDKLAEERAYLSAYVDAHKALISPARRFPLDVIQEIFTACLPAHRNCVMSAIEAPVLLGRICSAWETISLATPRLWPSLHIVQPYCRDITGSKLVQRLKTTKTWLDRSVERPLSISLTCGWDGPSPAANMLVCALLPFARRWDALGAHSVHEPRPTDSLLAGIAPS